MHTCEVPGDTLDKWLQQYPSTAGNYGHLLLEQLGASDAALIETFRPYFESAHLDAREHFHEEIGIDLHPDAGASGAHAIYPNCLPSKTRRGLFGEVMAGMVTQHYAYVGDHEWQVPIFLFRNHEDVKSYLFALARDPSLTREVMGRHGSDFLAIALDADGKVERYLAGEAKWRKVLSGSVVESLLLGPKVDDGKGNKVHAGKGIWHQFNERDKNLPHGMRQLQKLLKERDPDGFAAAIYSIDQALLLDHPTPIPRTNLVLICGNDYPSRGKGVPLIDWNSKPAEYKSPHDLQVVELFLTEGDKLIEDIYDCMWSAI
ncbi:hypothetical protein ACCC97_11305 [Variovorax sp. Varisp85]|jgi:hypothetical protein|uniref:hypothetical protein n=1 Tax=Variovorax sp. Varisp85 TaxID=3243059 RepID=UPI001AEB9BF8